MLVRQKNWRVLLRSIWMGLLAVLLAGLMTLPVLAADATYSTEGAAWHQVDDNTWIAYTSDGDWKNDKDIIATVIKNGDQWEYFFRVEDPDADYYGWESDVPGYTVDGQGTRSDPAWKDLTITNKKDNYSIPRTGTLTLTKKIAGTVGDATVSRNFRFAITLSSENAALREKLKGTKTFGTVTFVNGKGIAYLKGGDTITMSGIPEGVQWKVEESAADGYTTSMTVDNDTASNPASGKIAADTTVAVVCTNTKNGGSTPEASGSFKVMKKTVNGTEGDRFVFSAGLQNLKADTDYTVNVAGTSKSFHSNASGIAYVEFELSNKEIAEFKGLPIGATYQVKEEAADGYTASYEITSEESGTPLTVVMSRRSNAEENQALSTQKETLDSGEKALLTFTNRKPDPETGKIDLVVKKVWDDNNNAGKIRPDRIRVSLYQSTNENETGDMIATGQLDETSNWTYTFKELDQYQEGGTTPYYYTVIEDPVAGYDSKVEKSEDGSKITITNKANDQKLGDLKISKTVTGDNPPDNQEFRFTIHLSRSVTDAGGLETSVPVKGVFDLDSSEGKGTKTGTVYFDENGDAQITLKANESAYIKNLPAGAAYKVTEEALEGWTPSLEDKSADWEGTIEDTLTELKINNTWFETVSLTIAKTVKGNMGNKSREFQFALALTVPDGQTLPTKLYCEREDGKTVSLSLADGKYTFALAHGERIKISGIPKNSTYSLTETDADDYTVSYTVGDGSSQAALTGVTLDGDTEVNVLNERELSVPTLASMNTIAPIGFMLAAGVVLLFLIWKYMIAPYMPRGRRKKK